ncbi:MAG: hypothetical protein HKP32_11650 [Woeseia sp.]|nr:hypothetical protein [Woeseia sp.]NNL55796.1 hypothetical protein [Woeseia sp.]
MSRNHCLLSRSVLAAVLAASGQSLAAGGAELGVRVSALHAATHSQGIGLIVRWPMSQGYFAMASLDRQHYERGDSALSMPPAELRSTVVGAAFGREQRSNSLLQSWFWSWGLSAGFPTTGRNESAIADSLFTTATEIHLTASLGVSTKLSDNWTLTGTARLERHFVDWRLTAADGSLLGRKEALTASGLSLAVNYKF